MTETEKVQEVKRPIPDEMSQAAAVEIFGLLSRPMPAEALSIDGSRGFPLTSIKAGFILERLNQTFGLLGYGWRYAVGPFHLETAGGKEEILVEVAIQWRTSETLAEVYCPPIYWQRKTDPETGITTQGWCPEKTLPRCWSEPIVATGGSSAKRTGSVPLTDARRSAVTNAITKAASRLGVGNEVFKGQDELANATAPAKRERSGRVRQSGPATPKSTRASKATANGYPDLEAMQAAARVERAKLTVEDGQPEAKTVQSLAQKMAGLGIEMQAARLVHLLLGDGGFTQKGIMATFNILNSGQVTPANIEALNATARER